jgi:hypothetical protein
MKRILVASLALAAAMAVPASAMADSFSFTFTDQGVSGSGNLQGTEIAPGVYFIESGTISVTALPGSGFLSGTGSLDPCAKGFENFSGPGNNSFCKFGQGFTNDDLLFTNGGPQLDDMGLLFLINTPGSNVDLPLGIWGSGPGDYSLDEATSLGSNPGHDRQTYETDGNFTTVTPEPPILVLFGTGLLILALFHVRGDKALKKNRVE